MLIDIREYRAEWNNMNGNTKTNMRGRLVPGKMAKSGRYVVATPKPMFVTATVVMKACRGEIDLTIPVASLAKAVGLLKKSSKARVRAVLIKYSSPSSKS
jgi:hypothetical protein